CSTAWAMRTIGYAVSEDDVIAGLGPERISPSLGLLDASGAGLVSYLGEQGISAANNPSASFSDCLVAAGDQPMVIGGRAWNHCCELRVRRFSWSMAPPSLTDAQPISHIYGGLPSS